MSTSHSNVSKPTRLAAIENGPLSGTRTSASGNWRASRPATSITIGIRPAPIGSSGGNSANSSTEEQIAWPMAGIPVPWGRTITPP